MGLSMGIVGLPNVGKSTLFNAITNQDIQAANFPFCTIEPNKGIVNIPDPRLTELGQRSNSQRIIPATIEFIDIAGLVQGASKGEGLGNQFLANIREASAIVHVVRCFDDDDVVHVDGSVDPVRDIDIIETELILSDVQRCEKAILTHQKKSRSKNSDGLTKLTVLNKCMESLSAGIPIRDISLSDADLNELADIQFLTQKKVIYACNISEDELNIENNHIKAVRKKIESKSAELVCLSAQFEFEVSQLDGQEKATFLKEFGCDQSGLEVLASQCFKLLELETFLTTGEKETRAWTIPSGTLAPKAAAQIHTDFEKGFIRANVIDYHQFIDCGSYKTAKEKGLIRQEGKDYVVQDGDIIEFLFNV